MVTLDPPARLMDDGVVPRLLVLLAVVAAMLLVPTAPASAKTPPFTVELSDPAPEAGEVVTVTVRMWSPANPRQPDTLYRPIGGELNGLLAVVAAEDMEDGRPRPRSPQEPIGLRYVRPATLQGSFVAPEQGGYWIVPWPRVILMGVPEGGLLSGVPEDRQPTSMELVVQDTGRSPLVPVAALAVALAGAAGALGALRWRRRHPRVAVSPA